MGTFCFPFDFALEFFRLRSSSRECSLSLTLSDDELVEEEDDDDEEEEEEEYFLLRRFV